jgi:hypothetical protein
VWHTDAYIICTDRVVGVEHGVVRLGALVTPVLRCACSGGVGGLLAAATGLRPCLFLLLSWLFNRKAKKLKSGINGKFFNCLLEY